MAVGVWLELGGARARGSPGSTTDPGGMLPRGLLRFPRSDCFLSRPPSRKGQEAIEERKLVGLSHGEPAWRMGGSATTRVPSPHRGSLWGEGGWSFPAGRCKPGWEGGGQPPFPSQAGESLTAARELFGRGARCKQNSFHRPPRRAGSCSAAVACSDGCWLLLGRPRANRDDVPCGIGAGSGAGHGTGHSQRVPGRAARDTGFLQKALDYHKKSAVGSCSAELRASGLCARCWSWQRTGWRLPWHVVALLVSPRNPKAFKFASKGSPELVALSTVRAAFLPALFPAVLRGGQRRQRGRRPRPEKQGAR